MAISRLVLVCCMLIVFSEPQAEAGAWTQKKFIITYWSPPPASREALSSAAKEGFNLTWTYEYGLDVARAQGLMVMLQNDLLTPGTLDNPVQRAKLDALIDRVKNHPSLEAYYLADEPNASAFQGLGRLVAYLREHDPGHIAYINLYPVYATNKQLGTEGTPEKAYREYVRRFIEEVKPSLLSYDHYSFYKTRDGDQYFLNLELIRQAAQGSGLPFLNIVQASTIEKTWRLVTPNELRWLVYTTLAYGGRGIGYFLYWGPSAYGGLYQEGVKTPLVDAVAALNKELSAQSVPLLELDNLGTYHTGLLPAGTAPVPLTSPVQFAGAGSYVLGLFGKSNRITTFMVVNRNYQMPATAQLVLRPEVRSLEEFDRTAKQWKPYPPLSAGHGAAVPLNPGDGRLFRFVP